MNSFTLPSFAKINLSLSVLGKRADGFHEIFTVFQTVSLHDEITFAEHDSVTLSCSAPSVPLDGTNLIMRAAEALKARTGTERGASMQLLKRIPSPGGLGGGSSNAAAALLGLRRLWELEINDREMHEIAAGIGSDVPFFLHGGTAIGTGRGTDIEPVNDAAPAPMLIVTPSVDVATREAFASLNAENLTSADAELILIVCRLEAEKLDIGHSTLQNDMEAAVFARFPEVGRAKKRLLELGAVNAMMSGSGASVFAVFDKEETRQATLKALDNEVNWRKFAVAAVSRAEYRERMSGSI